MMMLVMRVAVGRGREGLIVDRFGGSDTSNGGCSGSFNGVGCNVVALVVFSVIVLVMMILIVTM